MSSAAPCSFQRPSLLDAMTRNRYVPGRRSGERFCGGRGMLPYELPAGTLKPGPNTVTVRITNNRNDGGFLGPPETMFAQAGETKVPLAGTWRYRVERQSNAGALYAKQGELAAHVALASSPAPTTGTLPEPAVRAAPDVVVRLSVKSGEMLFDKAELTVRPGQLVELVFVNPDEMPHNFVLGQPGSLNSSARPPTIWRAPERGGAEIHAPDSADFLDALVDPGQTCRFSFVRPPRPGEYPYVCTFPGHWCVMNGVLNVSAPQGRGGRGGI